MEGWRGAGSEKGPAGTTNKQTHPPRGHPVYTHLVATPCVHTHLVATPWLAAHGGSASSVARTSGSWAAEPRAPRAGPRGLPSSRAEPRARTARVTLPAVALVVCRGGGEGGASRGLCCVCGGGSVRMKLMVCRGGAEGGVSCCVGGGQHEDGG